MATSYVSREMVGRMMADPNNCETCYGCGRVNADTGESWLQWLALPPGSNLAVVMGLAQPKECPDCDGKGLKE